MLILWHPMFCLRYRYADDPYLRDLKIEEQILSPRLLDLSDR